MNFRVSHNLQYFTVNARVAGITEDDIQNKDIPEVRIREMKWGFATGAMKCLSHLEFTSTMIKIHCLNQPSGRYMLLEGSSNLQGSSYALLKNVLTHAWSIWVYSNKGKRFTSGCIPVSILFKYIPDRYRPGIL